MDIDTAYYKLGYARGTINSVLASLIEFSTSDSELLKQVIISAAIKTLENAKEKCADDIDEEAK
jgi:L-lysine 2,3-aminomutase